MGQPSLARALRFSSIGQVFPAAEKNYDCDTSQKSLLYLKQIFTAQEASINKHQANQLTGSRSGLYRLPPKCTLKFHQVPLVRVYDILIVMVNQVIGQTFSLSHSKQSDFSTSSGAQGLLLVAPYFCDI